MLKLIAKALEENGISYTHLYDHGKKCTAVVHRISSFCFMGNTGCVAHHPQNGERRGTRDV